MKASAGHHPQTPFLSPRRCTGGRFDWVGLVTRVDLERPDRNGSPDCSLVLSGFSAGTTTAIPVEHGGTIMKRNTLGIIAGTVMVALLGSTVARAGDVEIVNPNQPQPQAQVQTVPAAPPPAQPVAVEPTAPPVRK